MDLLTALFVNNFMPHGACYLWQADLLGLHAGSDFVIGAAYLSIPVFLFHLARRKRSLGINWVLVWFAAFIFLCGTTHLISILTLWQPVYCLQGSVKLATAAVSLFVATLLWVKLDWFMSFPSAADLKAANAELKGQMRLRERLEGDLRRSNEDLGNFASIASHDMREPLRGIVSYSGLLIEQYGSKLDADAQEYLGHITDGAARMNGMISSLLELSQVGRAQASRTRIEMNAVLGDATASLHEVIESCGAVIRADDLPVVFANRSELTRLLQNLIGNALKFTPPGVEPIVAITVLRQGGGWQFCVADNGIGIPAQYLDSVFDTFRRLHGRGDYEGSGIGLAICKRIVERHDGRIWAESEPGCGTRFYFVLPDGVAAEGR